MNDYNKLIGKTISRVGYKPFPNGCVNDVQIDFDDGSISMFSSTKPGRLVCCVLDKGQNATSAATSRENEKPTTVGEQTGGELAAAPCSPEPPKKAAIISESGEVIWWMSTDQNSLPTSISWRFPIEAVTKVQKLGYRNESLYFFSSKSPCSLDIESIWSSIVRPESLENASLDEYTLNPSVSKNFTKDSTSDSNMKKEAIVSWLNCVDRNSLDSCIIWGRVGVDEQANVQDEPTAESAQAKPADAAPENPAGGGSAPSLCSAPEALINSQNPVIGVSIMSDCVRVTGESASFNLSFREALAVTHAMNHRNDPHQEPREIDSLSSLIEV